MDKTTLAILCGGRSQRLGTDKGLFQPLDDEPLVLRAVRLWSESFSEVLVVVRSAEQAAHYQQALERHGEVGASGPSIRVIYDESSADFGPQAAISGLLTALMHSTSTLVALPVDQLGVRASHLRTLVHAAQSAGNRPASFDDDGDYLPFPSVWPRAATGPLAALVTAGALSVRGALQDLNAVKVPPGEASTELAINANTMADMREYFGAPLFDPFKRRLHYLRFSLTEACNLSCTYCLPDGFPAWYKHKARLDRPSIAALLGGFRALGFRKVRFTGGEPTVHPHCIDAVRLARRLGFEQIAMTSNGLLIGDLQRWIDAGLTDLNISLDSLDPGQFQAITKSRDVAKVRGVVEAAAASHIRVKVNTVLMRSLNGTRASIDALIDWAAGMPITLRFIELMETGLNASFAKTERVLGSEIEPGLLARGFKPLETFGLDLRGPATDFVSQKHPGRIGLINPMSCNFCSKCNRLRITAKGRLKLCLFGDQDLPLDLSSPEAVALNVRQLIDRKPERHYLSEGNFGNVATFRTIGG